MTTETVETDGVIQKPWYKQFWPWYLIFLPASAVTAGIATVIIAVNNQDHMVVDNYYKEGLAINRVISAQQQAAQLNLQARAILDPQTGELDLSFSGNRSISEDVRLSLVHPTINKFDQQFLLSKTSDNHFVLNIKDVQHGRWSMILESTNKDWRLDADVILPTGQWMFKPDV